MPTGHGVSALLRLEEGTPPVGAGERLAGNDEIVCLEPRLFLALSVCQKLLSITVARSASPSSSLTTQAEIVGSPQPRSPRVTISPT